MHYEWSLRAIEAGKHVLVEKPIAGTADEARQIFLLAAEKGVVVLEGTHILSVTNRLHQSSRLSFVT